MGMEATLKAIGKFERHLADKLDYSADFYKDTKEGALVMTSFFVAVTSSQSRELAEALGFDAWDFNHHIFQGESIFKLNDMSALKEILGDEDYNKLLMFAYKNWLFIYEPNG